MVAEASKFGRDENSNLRFFLAHNSQLWTSGKETTQLNFGSPQCHNFVAASDETVNQAQQFLDLKFQLKTDDIALNKVTPDDECQDSPPDNLIPISEWIIKETEYVFRRDLHDPEFLKKNIEFLVKTENQCPIKDFLTYRNVVPLVPVPATVVARDPYRTPASRRRPYKSTTAEPYYVVPYDSGYIHDPQVPYQKGPVLRLKQPEYPKHQYPTYTYL